MAIKPGYVNPLTMMGHKKNTLATPSLVIRQKNEKKDDVQDLQIRQQALQNSVLLLKSTTDGAAGTAETQEALQKKLEEIAAELKTAKAQEAQAVASQPVKERFDRYEKGVEQMDLPDFYEIQKNGKASWNIVRSPYAGQQ